MSAIPGADNAIAYAQVRLRGGWKNLGSTGAAYGLVVAGTIVASVRMAEVPAPTICRAWLGPLLGLQGMLLFLFGGSRVTAAVRHDLNSRMIESHRLMPIGSGRAVLGYVLGATSQATVLAGVTLVIGAAAAAVGGVPATHWLGASAGVALSCACAWFVLAYLAFLVRAPFALTVLPVVGLLMTEGRLWTVLPPAAVLCGPTLGPPLFAPVLGGGPGPYAYAASAACQLAVAVVCFAAARRLYARDDAVGLGPLLGLCLLAAFAAASWLGIGYWDAFRPRWVRVWRREDPADQLTCSLVLLLVLALVPVAAAARLDGEWRRRRTREPTAAGRRPVPGLLVALAAAAVVATLPPALVTASAGPAPRREALPPVTLEEIANPWAGTAAVVLLALAAYGYALRLAPRLKRSAQAVGVGWLALAWLGPIVADAVRSARADPSEPAAGSFWALASYSPLGAVVLIWKDPAAGFPTTAVVAQAGLALLTGLLWLAVRPPRRLTA